jgi:hypothetical protein
MTKSDDKPRKSPVDRFHNILSAGQKKEDVVETRRSSMDRLPKAKPVTDQINTPEQSTTPAPTKIQTIPQKSRALPRLWTIASIISMAINAVLVVALLIIFQQLGGLSVSRLGTGVLGGLYTNFERMDQAHIRTTIPVQTTIPLNLSIPVQTTTAITLAQSVVINNAHVKIATSTFNIDSNADVTLPAGTTLNVNLNFTLPVQTTVPVTLNVPVDIAVAATDLHPAITGLESTIQPLYCMVNAGAISLDGTPICR